MHVLTFKGGDNDVRVRLHPPVFTIGRGMSNHLQLADESLGVVHLKLLFRNNRWYVDSGDPSIPPMVNGHIQKPPYLLQQGDALSIGKRQAVFGPLSAVDDTLHTKALNEAGREPVVRYIEGPLTRDDTVVPRRVRLDNRRFVIGASRDCDLCIESPYVSRHHAELCLEASGRTWLKDTGSRNGTKVNGHLVRETELRNDDVISMGTLRLAYRESESLVPPGDIEAMDVPGIIGISKGMETVRDLIRRFARHRAPVLICGETGTGKELVAEALHALSGRVNFVPINAGAMPETLVESLLFGHCKGAFTGAEASVQGAVRDADGGTLFLDEIGEMPLAVQPRLLRTVEHGEVKALGASKVVKTSTRFVFATNRNLAAEVRRKRFREDLFYRINTLIIKVPPLRERTEDIPLLARYFVAELGGSMMFSTAAITRLKKHSWPGNVRELRSVITRTLLTRYEVMQRGVIDADDLLFGELLDSDEPLHAQPPMGEKNRKEHEREVLVDTLNYHSGNKSRAAKALGISRSTLYDKIRRWGIE